MLGIDFLTAGTLLIMANTQNELCKMPAPTQINVKPISKKLRYDTKQSLKQIQKVQTDTINPHGFGGVSYTQAYMNGQIKIVPNVEISDVENPDRGYACLWYTKININIEIDPEIVIAREVYRDRCMREAVIGHEKKHVKVDRKIVNKYARTMGNKIYEGLKERGFMAGPIRIEDKDAVVARMQRTVGQLLENEYKRMLLDRTEMQQAVDSRAEYERVDAMCPNFDNQNTIE